MVDYKKVLTQLSKVGYNSRVWQKSEVKELCNILHEDEIILQACNGHYEGGFALLVATDQRLLLVDKKPMFLTLDSITYPMIQEVSFDYRLLNSTIHVHTTGKCLDFNSWNHGQVRQILNHVQMQIKNHQSQIDNNDSRPRYMSYEQMQVPETDINDVPTMPSPAPQPTVTTNAGVYEANPSLASSPIKPIDLVMNTKLSAYKTPFLVSRGYARRYY